MKVRNAAEGGWLDKHDEFDFAGSLHFKKIPLPDDIPVVENRSAFSVEPIGEGAQPAVFYMDGRKVFIPAKARSDFIDAAVDALLWGRAKHNLYWACAITFVILLVLIRTEVLRNSKQPGRAKENVNPVSVTASRLLVLLGAFAFPLFGTPLNDGNIKTFNLLLGVWCLALAVGDYMTATRKFPLLE